MSASARNDATLFVCVGSLFASPVFLEGPGELARAPAIVGCVLVTRWDHSRIRVLVTFRIRILVTKAATKTPRDDFFVKIVR